MTLRVAMWSGPRNISTAMMRSWENRGDTAVSDEPFYAHYLVETGAPHPGREEIIASQPTDWRDVAANLTGPVPGGRSFWYQKHMSQHFLDHMGTDWLADVTNCFLIRDPALVVASFTKNRPDAALWELGFEQQARLFDHLADRLGEAPPVLDAADVLKDPEGMLRALCHRLGITFTERMLAWPPGLRDSDGVWARHWYHNVAESTGFAPYREKQVSLDGFQQRLVDECRPHYERLHGYRIKVER